MHLYHDESYKMKSCLVTLTLDLHNNLNYL